MKGLRLGLWALVLVTVLFCLPSALLAQAFPPAGEAANSNQPVTPPKVEKDPLGRETPAGMVAGFLAALETGDYGRAAKYLDLSNEVEAQGPVLVRQLQQILDRGGRVESTQSLSNDPIGRQNDGLQPNQERFGTVRDRYGEVDLVATRVDTEVGKLWLVSAKNVRQLSYLARSVPESVLDKHLPESLNEQLLWGVPVGHWLALAVLVLATYAAAWLMTMFVWLALQRTSSLGQDSQLGRSVRASAVPVRVLVAAVLTWIVANFIGVSIIARQRLGIVLEILFWIAVAWIAWRIIDAFAKSSEERLALRGSSSLSAGITFLRRSVKFALFAFAVMAGLSAAGINVSAGLAALGIGGIAIALGAQKTVENLVGSLTLIADQSVRVGDFCKFGDALGTVEDIGMWSTKIRTLSRTLVRIPNGQLASMQIENYDRRDRFWFHHVLELRYETSPAQVRDLLASIRELLAVHEDVVAKPARVRLIGLGQSALKVEVFAYFGARDYNHFLELQEDVTLRIMDLVEQVGTTFAFGSQTIYVARDRGVSSVAQSSKVQVRSQAEPQFAAGADLSTARSS